MLTLPLYGPYPEVSAYPQVCLISISYSALSIFLLAHFMQNIEQLHLNGKSPNLAGDTSQPKRELLMRGTGI